MSQFLASILDQVRPTTLLDIAIVAVLTYWVFSLIRGTRAVSLVIGVSVLIAVYAAAQFLGLRLLSQILQTGAYVGLFALVVVFQPELRRALEQIGRVGSFGWILIPGDVRSIGYVAAEVSRAAGLLSADGHGALIVLERETRLGEIAETGVLINGDLSSDLLRTIFMPRSALHDGAVIVRGRSVVAAGAVLPLAETTVQSERFGTRHRAALGITEQTDAAVVVVSEENGHISLVERGRIVRNLSAAQLERAIRALLDPNADRRGRLRWRGTPVGLGAAGRAGRRFELPRLGGRPRAAGAARPPDDDETARAAARAPR
jgi:diadenylate cyclase